MDNTIISVKNLSKLYGPEQQKAIRLKKKGVDKDEIYKKTGVTIALWDVSLEIEQGEIFVIIGLSGSGKSTLVRCFNRLNKPTHGNVFFQGEKISGFDKKRLRDYRRNRIAMVFQHFGLMSHRSVIGNVEYGLEIKGLPKEERRSIAKEMLSMVGLEDHENEPISNLSGGMRQRVGLARALASNPDLLLMDEPFSALDPLVRKDMQLELLTIQKKLKKTIIFITHDINEAFLLGDRVAIMKDGEVIQTATPQEMSKNPYTDYVKQFIDSADKTHVLDVGNVMITPNSIVRLGDTLNFAIRTMKNNGVSSAYVIDKNMRLQGVLTIDNAIKANKSGRTISDVLIKDINTTSADTLLADIIEVASTTPFPIAVVDEDFTLKGIVSKAHVLSSISS